MDFRAMLEQLADEDFCYLTTTGRITGKQHTIEIWFALHETTLYMLAGGRDRSDWVKNIRQSPAVTVRIKDSHTLGNGRILADSDEDTLARRIVVAKYQPRDADDLSNWGRTALAVAIDLSQEQHATTTTPEREI